jgi:hypothetical protein
MDYEEYRRRYFVDPPPEPRFALRGQRGATLMLQDFDRALEFYSQVFGPPGYVEGAGTRSWLLGDTWVTLLRGNEGNAKNVEVQIEAESPQEAERLHAAFREAGGKGPDPSDEFMHIKLRFCSVRDPFGVDWLIVAPLADPKD